MATQAVTEREQHDRCVTVLTSMSARAAFTAVAAAHPDLDQLAVELARLRRTAPLARVIEVWDLAHADIAAMFSVSRQAVAKWMSGGVPAERSGAIADLAAATDLLERYIKRDRIAAVVRRPAPALAGRSLLGLATDGKTGEVLAACRTMFTFELANS